MASGRSDADGRRGVLRLLAAGLLAVLAVLAAGVARRLPGASRRRMANDDQPGREARFWRRV